jgi:hypothetical protein
MDLDYPDQGPGRDGGTYVVRRLEWLVCGVSGENQPYPLDSGKRRSLDWCTYHLSACLRRRHDAARGQYKVGNGGSEFGLWLQPSRDQRY